MSYCTHIEHSARGTSAPPALVVPVLLCHGKAAWPDTVPAYPHLEGLDPAAAAMLAALQPRVRFLVDDLMLCTEAELRRPGLTALAQLTLLCLRFLRWFTVDEALAAIDRWADLLRGADRDDGPPPGRDAVAEVGWYFLAVTEIPPEDLHATFQSNLQRPEETIMSTAEKLIREGRAKGRAEGRAETILRVLVKRFGPLPADIGERVQSATLPELDRWTDRMVDARTLADVFAT